MTTTEFTHKYVPGSSSDGRTILLLHGTGGDENDLLSLGRVVAPTAGLLSPRGKVLENGMPRFFRRLAEGVFDFEDLKVRTEELADWIGWAAAQYKFDLRQLVALGYSNGANIAASILLTRPEVIGEAALLRAMMPLERRPSKLPDLSGKRVLLSLGERDPMIPAASSKLLGETLREAGADVTLRTNPGGHGLGQHDVNQVREWLANAATRLVGQ
jgi:phospholipase/carboxylesterase